MGEEFQYGSQRERSDRLLVREGVPRNPVNHYEPNPHSLLGREVTVQIDRPLGSVHPRHASLIYLVNYGFVPGTRAPDGEEIDAYVLGIGKPLESFTGVCTALLHRADDEDDKLIVVPKGFSPTDEQILAATHFQEQYFSVTLVRAATN